MLSYLLITLDGNGGITHNISKGSFKRIEALVEDVFWQGGTRRCCSHNKLLVGLQQKKLLPRIKQVPELMVLPMERQPNCYVPFPKSYTTGSPIRFQLPAHSQNDTTANDFRLFIAIYSIVIQSQCLRRFSK